MKCNRSHYSLCKYAINRVCCNDSKMDAGLVSNFCSFLYKNEFSVRCRVILKFWSQSRIVRDPFCSYDTTGYHDNWKLFVNVVNPRAIRQAFRG